MRMLLLLAAVAGSLRAQAVIELPPATPAGLRNGTRFEFSSQGERNRIWGGGPEIPRVFFKGDLPALFSRTIVLETAIPEGSALDWVFTGDEGGFTVHIAPGRVGVSQRYYDSFGLHAMRPPKARYAEKVWDESEVAYSGKLESVTVALDHRLGLLLSLNGKQVATETCLLEVRRHQLGWTPATGAKSGRVAGSLIEPPVIATEITVNPQHKHQSIYGFGGILSAPAYAKLSAEGKREWWKLIAEYNLLIHREYPNGNRLKPDLSNFDRLEDATPHYYGDNFPNGEITDFQYIRQIRKLGGRVFFEFWELPPWAELPPSARQEYKAKDGRTYRGAPILSEYVRAMVGYCKIAKEKTGQPPDVVGIQNEVMQPAEVWHEMILELRKALDREGFRSVKIHMPDMGILTRGTATLRAIQLSPAAWKTIDYTATHFYDFQGSFQDPDGYDAAIRAWKEVSGDKAFLSTELAVTSSAYQSRSYRTAFAQAQLYHKNMALMDAAALLYCWTLLDVEQPSFGATRSLFVADRAKGAVPVPSSYQLRAFGAYSRRLREGMVRVDATANNPDLLVTAYEGRAGARTAILINRAMSPQRVQLNWPGAAFTVAELTSPYLENAVMKALPRPLVLQPGEIVTLSTVPLGAALRQ